ncbi:hypothetical protein CSB11_01015 [Candidatus Campbellbacteria bacterium]|nr:MAG: hypothetical protein CSB11_01015 [Candidatus Campbellbacteria bacterium]
MNNNLEQKFKEAFESLNQNQKKAVEQTEGPVVVNAGPGTGKTQILALRIANIIKKNTAETASSILALTFTNSGVVSMRKRLIEFLGTKLAYSVNIFTFHSFCEEQIKNFPEYFPKYQNSTVVDNILQYQIVEDILKQKDWQYFKTFGSTKHYVADIVFAISKIKSEGLSKEKLLEKNENFKKQIELDENSYYKRDGKYGKKGDLKKDILKPYEKNLELAEIYELYEKSLEEKNLYDFSDMILSVVKEAEKKSDFLFDLQEKFLYILVDEHQDTNEAQNKIVELIASAEVLENKPNVFTVGDPKQAIYRFAGASKESFENFKNIYTDVLEITLDKNYRSSQNILDASYSTISENKLISSNKALENEKSKIKVKEFLTYQGELYALTQSIKKQKESGVEYKDIAVFYRDNKHLKEIKNTLNKNDIPVSVFSKENILEDIGILKLFKILKAVDNFYQNKFVSEAMFVDFLNINYLDILKINKTVTKGRNDKSIYSLITDQKRLEKKNLENQQEVLDFGNFLKEQKEFEKNHSFLEFFENFIKKSGFLEYILKSENSANDLQKLDRFYNLVKDFYANDKNLNLEKFLEKIEVLKYYNLKVEIKENSTTDGVNLMTAHASKGLEFDYVYITNFANKVWGNKKNPGRIKLPIKIAEGDNDDERRLFFVAQTRAKKGLCISYSIYDNKGKERLPSLFLENLEDELIDFEKTQNDKKEQVLSSFEPLKQNKKSILDKDFIQEEFLERKLSVSALNNYFQSPILYFFRNLIRIPSVQNKTLIYGDVIHKSLETFFTQSKEEGKILSQKKLLEIFVDVLEKSDIDSVDFEETEKRGKECLKNYYNFYKNDFSLDIETEKFINKVVFNIDDEKHLELIGFVDKIIKNSDGSVTVVDYKTGKPWSKKKKEEKEDLKRQLTFYKLLLAEYEFGKYKFKEAVLDFVEPNDNGEFERIVFNTDELDVEVLKNEIKEFAEDILSGEFLQKALVQNKLSDRHKEYEEFLDTMGFEFGQKELF